MSMVPLLELRIYRHSKDQYHQIEANDIDRIKGLYERGSQEKFEDWPYERQTQFLQRNSFPPWEYNDYVGFLVIGMDGSDSMIGWVFLKRKWFPRGHYARHSSLSYGPNSTEIRKNQGIFYYNETPSKYKIYDLDDNDAYLESAKSVIKDGSKMIARINKSFLLEVIYYDLSVIDFSRKYNSLQKSD